MLGSFIGGFSILFLFLPITNESLFFIKLLFSVILMIITFSYRNLFYTIQNLLYFYMVSFFLGGTLYALKVDTWFQNSGLSLFKHSFFPNVIGLLIISPIVLYFYIKQSKRLKQIYQKYYKVTIQIGKKKWKGNGFLDTGNRLCDPISHKPVILLNKSKFEKIEKNQKFIFVPYKTITESGVIKCLFIDDLFIEGVGNYSKVLLGKMEDHIMMDGVDVILNEKIWEG